MPLKTILPLCICGDRGCRVPYGYCHCGCGRQTQLAPTTKSAWRQVKGMPYRYVGGHNARHPRIDSDSLGQFKIDGQACRLLPLTRGLFAIIDADRYSEDSRYNWNARWSVGSRSYYAVRNMRAADGRRTSEFLHRRIMGVSLEDPRRVDHKEPIATLDNRRANLRIATCSQQQCNQRRRRDNTSGYKGVSRDKARGQWAVYVSVQGKRHYIGRFQSKRRAYKAYCDAAQRLHGEFARIK